MRRRIGTVGLAAGACCAALISLSSGGSAQSSTPHPPASLVSTALAAWSRFPVHAFPRPLVLIDDDNVNAPVFGFPNDATKIAFLDGTITPPSTYPTGPRLAAGFPVVNAQPAFNILKDNGGTATPGGPPATNPLVVTSVTLGTGVFGTDRGRRTLPAWLFGFQNIENPGQVLAVSPKRIFTPPRVIQPDAVPTTSSIVGSATLASDHRTLTVEFAGAAEGTGPCQATYSLRVGASSTAVAVVVDGITHYAAGVACALQASPIHLSTKLAKPLGNRVVVDANSSAAVPVLP